MTQRTTLAAFRRSIPMFVFVLALFACTDDKSDNSSEPIEGNSLLLNFTSDNTTGELRWMALDATSLSNGTLSFEQNSKVSTGNGNIFVLSNHFGGNGTLACILPQQIGNVSTIMQNALEGQNPYEAAVIGAKGYIAMWDEDFVQVFNISSCAPSGKINLPISGTNASTIKASGDTLLITLQRLENFAATKPGLLVRINASTGKLIDTLQLKYYNPSSSILSKGKLYVSSQGVYNADYSIDVTKAGIEVVDLATKTSETLVTGIQLEGGVSSIALDEANQILYASAYVVWGDSPVKSVNLSTKTVGNSLPNILAAGDLVFDKEGKKLFVADADGLKIYNPSIKSTTAVNQGAKALPPVSLAIVNF